MTYKYSRNIFFSLVLLFAASCSEDKMSGDMDHNSQKNSICSIMVSLPEDELSNLELSTRNDADDNNGDFSEEEWPEININVVDDESKEKYDVSDLKVFDNEFDENTVIYVSQMTRDITAFQNEDVTYAYSFLTETKNDPDVNWNEGYNFTPSANDDPLEWFKIGNGGTYLGGYSLYALYFPIDNEIRRTVRDDGKYLYGVLRDQSNLEDLKRSDILGAYHATSDLFSRLRFKLHHMTSYIRVRLYVPVYDETTHTGFMEESVDHATLSHVSPDFIIEWTAARSSDSQGPAVIELEGDEDIVMYQHPVGEGTQRKKGLLNYKKFLNANDYAENEKVVGGDWDKVKIYDFSVLVPLQLSTMDEDGHPTSFLSEQFLNFYMKSASGALTRYYYSQKQIPTTGEDGTNNEDTSTSLTVEQEKITYLQLYIPRVGKSVVYLKSSVNPWKQFQSSFMLNQEED